MSFDSTPPKKKTEGKRLRVLRGDLKEGQEFVCSPGNRYRVVNKSLRRVRMEPGAGDNLK